MQEGIGGTHLHKGISQKQHIALTTRLKPVANAAFVTMHPPDVLQSLEALHNEVIRFLPGNMACDAVTGFLIVRHLTEDAEFNDKVAARAKADTVYGHTFRTFMARWRATLRIKPDSGKWSDCGQRAETLKWADVKGELLNVCALNSTPRMATSQAAAHLLRDLSARELPLHKLTVPQYENWHATFSDKAATAHAVAPDVVTMNDIVAAYTVSYTHLTLPTNREV